MNYKVLYRKYRPDSFDNLIGQKHVISVLKNSIIEGKIAHAYLFSGPRGTGKTSTARILAKTINCLDNKDGIACGKCANCLLFQNSPDIIEIDAASNNGVDEIRELINNVKIMPSSYKYKVYIIDEVHMLSTSAFNALLLTLEEPPEHVIFILATTNVESVPITILSRCQKFDFKRISNNDIVDRLEYVCKEENIEYDLDGLKEVSLLSDGGLRDALSLLDQLSKLDTKITADLVNKEFGSVSDAKIKELIKAIDNSDIEKINDIFNTIQEINLNYKVVIKKIINELCNVGVEILKDNSKWNMSYDIVKKIVMELNDLILKININVDPYLLIKLCILGYVNVENTKELPNKVLVDNDIKTNNIQDKKIDYQVDINKNIKENESLEKNNINVSNKLIDIRINNCFVGASKEILKQNKEKWIDFTRNVQNNLIKGLVSDTIVVTSSMEYMIIVCNILHKEDEINDNLSNIESEFSKFVNKEYKLIFIGVDRWNVEKDKYIKNIRSNYKYEYISEDVKDNNEVEEIIDDIDSIFDKNKIEVE